MKFRLPPSRPWTYGGKTSAALSFLPTEPATVMLLSVKGMRADTPIPMSALNRLSTRPAVSTTNTLAHPHPHPPPPEHPLPPERPHRRRLLSSSTGDRAE